mgnify:CR=1 FL=1
MIRLGWCIFVAWQTWKLYVFYPSCMSFAGCVLMSAVDMACFCLSVCASFVCLRASRQKEQQYGAAAGVASHKEKL